MRLALALLLLLAAPAWGQVAEGVRCDGKTDDRAAINRSITRAHDAGGGVVLLPAGVCRIDVAAGFVKPQSNVVLAGQGMGITTVLADDSAKAGGTAIANWENGRMTAMDHFTLRDMTLQGLADHLHSFGADGVRIEGRVLVIERVESRYSRAFGLAILGGSDVVIRDSVVFRSFADGIVVWNTSNAQITGNRVVQAHDNAISAHSTDGAAGPVRAGLIIVDNIIVESAGISVLGAKTARISGNVLQRIMGAGLIITPGHRGYAQGNTAQFALQVEGNIIEDVFHNPETPAFNGQQFYIQIDGGAAQAGNLAAPPGRPAPANGAATPLYGSGRGHFYADPTTAAAMPSPGPHWLVLRNNTLVRTLPAVPHVSDWGYASSANGLWIAGGGDKSGTFNGPVTEAQLRTSGVVVTGPLRDTLFEGNTIETGGSNCFYFNGPASGAGFGAHDLDGVVLARNVCRDFAVSGIAFAVPPGSPQEVRLVDNLIDGDPHFTAGGRAPGGTWRDVTALPGIFAPDVIGLQVQANRFRNVSTASVPVTSGRHVYADNVEIGQFAAQGFSTRNRGLGVWHGTEEGWNYLIEDSAPASAELGTMLFAPQVTAAARPSTGIWPAGAYVRAEGAAETCGMPVLGWRRLTTGDLHAETDWAAVYGRHPVVVTAVGERFAVPAAASAVVLGTATRELILPDPATVPLGCEMRVMGETEFSLAAAGMAGGKVRAPAGFMAISDKAWQRSR